MIDLSDRGGVLRLVGSNEMDLHHQYSPSNHTDERLVFQPGTSRIDARLVPLPDTSSGDDDDIWINPNSVLRGNIARLAAQGVDLPGSGPLS